MIGWMDGWGDGGWMDGWMGGCKYVNVNIRLCIISLCMHVDITCNRLSIL